MELKIQETPDDVRVIYLSGRMDIAGTNEIHENFTQSVGTERAWVIVDLSQVSFVASIGMRTLVSSARSLLRVGGAMVMANAQPAVRQALSSAGIDSLIPAYPDEDRARLALLALRR